MSNKSNNSHVKVTKIIQRINNNKKMIHIDKIINIMQVEIQNK